MAKKIEKTEETQQQTTGSAEVEETFIAQVTDIYNRTGAGGDVTICRVQLRHNGKSIFRSVQGPVEVGHLLALRECVRESRRSR